MKSEIIEINGVSMMFKLSSDRISSLKEYITSALSGKLSYKEFWALNNISINIKKGEVIGIIGHNGSGKSTLLKIISGIMKPTKGNIICNGNIVPMLELGSGFDFDLTGKENIYLNGAILGYSKKFLDEKYKEILEFSELGEFINVPIRNYSSGMMMRLAFSIATVVNPDILIVDEILSVGDEAFQEKSRKRMEELMSGGTTVLFVSHSLNQIREMCNRVVWLDHGKIRMIGDAEEVCDKYAL
ncbi:teichoic acid ABC transporter ATP-binding protein [Clostridium diolis]|uniref:ABC transporter ATP-binding protein n=1 Tax=Clostridium diolis TaxID=223919 RepID=UPI000B405A30|nr:ABC transporter ATP-binding protein [Clostridium diolis]OVE67348.1 teichoic acid ABC transporter ATP-binding protein [Clostridium diolis]